MGVELNGSRRVLEPVGIAAAALVHEPGRRAAVDGAARAPREVGHRPVVVEVARLPTRGDDPDLREIRPGRLEPALGKPLAAPRPCVDVLDAKVEVGVAEVAARTRVGVPLGKIPARKKGRKYVSGGYLS